MTGPRRSLAVALVAIVLGAVTVSTQRTVPAPVTPLPSKPAERAVPFAVGERLTYDISWSSFLTAATATVTVLDKKPSYGSTAYYIAAEGTSVSLVAALYPLYYKADTLLDVYSLLPQRFSLFSRERSRQQMKMTLFDQRARTARYEVRDGRTGAVSRNRTLGVPAGTLDPLAALFAMRILNLRPGLETTLPVIFNETIYRVRMKVAAPDRVGTGPGARRAWRITPVVVDENAKTTPRRMSVWISDDKRRLPVRMEVELAFGRFEFTLTGVR